MKALTPETAERGAVILDKHSSERFLIIWVNENSLDCLDPKFDRISIGIKYIGSYYILDKIDMNRFTDWLSKRIVNYDWL